MADRQLIEKTCKATSSYDLCLSILLANPDSQNANLTGLGLIMVDAVKVKGEQSILQIDNLIKTRPDLREVLKKCRFDYGIIVTSDVKVAIDALNLGDYKYGVDAMDDTINEAEDCELSFGQHHQTSPITEVNKAMEDLGTLARDIIRMLL